MNNTADVQTPAEQTPAVAMATVTSPDDGMHEQLKNSFKKSTSCRLVVEQHRQY